MASIPLSIKGQVHCGELTALRKIHQLPKAIEHLVFEWSECRFVKFPCLDQVECGGPGFLQQSLIAHQIGNS